jgi:hypothetical protein
MNRFPDMGRWGGNPVTAGVFLWRITFIVKWRIVTAGEKRFGVGTGSIQKRKLSRYGSCGFHLEAKSFGRSEMKRSWREREDEAQAEYLRIWREKHPKGGEKTVLCLAIFFILSPSVIFYFGFIY